MTIYEWADRLSLDPRRGRNPEDFWARCPCHSDTHASLHVYIGHETGQIVMKCHACGAKGKDVCEAMGLPIGEVMCDAMSGETDSRGDGQRKKPAAKGPRLSRLFEVGRPMRVGGGE